MPCLLDNPVSVYRPRQPRESEFHHLIRDHFDDFRVVYADRYAREFGHWQSILQTYHALLGNDAKPGGVLAIQTFGQLMHFHPHIHGLVTDGAFTPDGRFRPLPMNLGHEPFLHIWENNVFRLLLDENRIEPDVVAQIRSWQHCGFSVDRSVRLSAGDRQDIERLAQYMARCPFSLARIVRVTRTGQVVYHAEKQRAHDFLEHVHHEELDEPELPWEP